MSGWAVLAIVAGVSLVFFWLAWWSSGRSGPSSRPDLSQAEKDYMAYGSQHSTSIPGGF